MPLEDPRDLSGMRLFGWIAIWVTASGLFSVHIRHTSIWGSLAFMLLGVPLALRYQKDGFSVALWALLTMAMQFFCVFVVPPLAPDFEETFALDLELVNVAPSWQGDADMLALRATDQSGHVHEFALSPKSVRGEPLTTLQLPAPIRIWSDGERPLVWQLEVDGRMVVPYADRTEAARGLMDFGWRWGGSATLLFLVAFVWHEIRLRSRQRKDSSKKEGIGPGPQDPFRG